MGTRNTKYYRDGYGLKQLLQDLLNAPGVNMTNAGGFYELQKSQNLLSGHKIVVYDGLRPDGVISVEIPFRTRNYTFYIMLDISMG